MIRLLTFTTLFPDSERPNHGIFVENRLRHLVATGEATSVVMAPTPWFPFTGARFGAWSRFARVPAQEARHGLTIHHPRYGVIPKLGMSAAPLLLYLASRRALRRLVADGLRFDVIDAHYAYPDGVAAVWLGRHFGKPVVITARGSDVTQLPGHAIPRRLIRTALARADGLIGVSSALCDRMIALGAAPDKVTTLRNGVDTSTFRPVDRAAARAALGLTRPTLISVGLLIERKGHDRTIAAMTELPDFDLIIVGEGPDREKLASQIAKLGLSPRVRLLGAQPHARLPLFYGAADAMVLASSREGWANVLLESMACGTPVVASNIPGNPEVVRAPEAGLVVESNTPAGIAAGVRRLFAALPDRAATRAYAERFGWDETSAGQLALFRRVLGRSA
ncbi:glycosyltransferase family 4 protein [Limobrevibacterium gyesilva]|uniref:Glycosyltransferase family 4 protein n=1 Tax=Limobrevibacterium gyesilva TaxID=2991712 RepID=A0AA41YRD6_9PROT|nr:glycosyltransferase family 4 protein [Limobrevibacterium gyesilva]MCW3476908.1 glycosyltransferase family 4 protein [Limobrevibacterium gyesilva]